MPDQNDSMAERTVSRLRIRDEAGEAILLFAAFCISVHVFVPEVNEAHYLCKARHYWNSSWCAGDLFLESADAHRVFFWSFGWTTRILPLPLVAWLGRIVAWLWLAFAWIRLSRTMVPRAGYGLLSGCLFASAVHWGNLSGEWILGGIEAKGFSYPLVLMALQRVAVNDWRWCWVWLGLATSLHPLVGGWAWVSAGLAWILCNRSAVSLVNSAAWMLGGLLLAAPGLFAALNLNANTDAAEIQQAEVLYVFVRLSHHLLPYAFPLTAWLRFSLLTVLWAFLVLRTFRYAPLARVHAIVGGAVLIAGCGCVIYEWTVHDRALCSTWMRYYWFRWSDVAVPLGLALATVQAMAEVRTMHPNQARRIRVLVSGVAGLGILAGPLSQTRQLIPPGDQQGLMMVFESPAAQQVAWRDWTDACIWIRDHTPEGTRCLTPRCQQTFKWYAQRAEIASWKDIPQDARGICDWWFRYRDTQPRYTRGRANPLSIPQAIDWAVRKADAYGAHYGVALRRRCLASHADAAAELLLPPARPPNLPSSSSHRWQPQYVNDTFVVYRIREPVKIK